MFDVDKVGLKHLQSELDSWRSIHARTHATVVESAPKRLINPNWGSYWIAVEASEASYVRALEAAVYYVEQLLKEQAVP